VRGPSVSGWSLPDHEREPRVRGRWLDRWLGLALERARSDPVLEIGCGHGDDTVTLTRAGLGVHAFDLSRFSVAIAAARAPAARVQCRDIRSPLPVDAGAVGVVVASLSLHYFPWDETVTIVGRVRDALRPGGVLLCRLNSTHDRNFGASGHPAIEPNYFMVNGHPKRFFDEATVRSLFAGWNELALEHIVTRKYVTSKALWEVVVEKPA
jgi:SAM-dependent methyltransferase